MCTSVLFSESNPSKVQVIKASFYLTLGDVDLVSWLVEEQYKNRSNTKGSAGKRLTV